MDFLHAGLVSAIQVSFQEPRISQVLTTMLTKMLLDQYVYSRPIRWISIKLDGMMDSAPVLDLRVFIRIMVRRVRIL